MCLEALTASLKEQASQIQKVSAEFAAASPSLGGLELNKFAARRIRRGGPAPQPSSTTSKARTVQELRPKKFRRTMAKAKSDRSDSTGRTL